MTRWLMRVFPVRLRLGFCLRFCLCYWGVLVTGCTPGGGSDVEAQHSGGGLAAATDASPSLRVGAVRVGAVLGGDAVGFARATEVVPFDFPKDHGPHPSYRSEWWYLTCPLVAGKSNAGAEYGVQFTLFRQALVPPAQAIDGRAIDGRAIDSPAIASGGWRSGQMYMAHAALTDVDGRRHYEDSRLARGHPKLAGVSAQPFAAWLEDWRLSAPVAPFVVSEEGLDTLQLRVNTSDFMVELDLHNVKPIVLQGDRGLSYKGSREASYYYSLPRISATGHVRLLADQSGLKTPVAGACWLDREWSTSVLADDLVGWDWFALQFEDLTELMLFQLRGDKLESQHRAEEVADSRNLSRNPSRNPSRKQGKRVQPDGSSKRLDAAKLRFEPLRFWQDETGARWPVEWQVITPTRRLRVVAALDDQRMRSSIEYWEGLVWVFEGDRRVGQGYLEMTGYTQ